MWFKNKIELKNLNSIMSSVYEKSGVKIGSELTVPQNYECLIYHNSKYYLTLPTGKYKVDNISFLPLFEKQQKGSKKLKRLKFVSHYINLSPQKIEMSVKKAKCTISFEITNTVLFAEYILLYTYKTDNNYTYYCLKDTFEECIKTFKTDTLANANKYLTKLGIKITHINNNPSHKSIFDTDSQFEENTIAPQSATTEQNYNENPNPISNTQNLHNSQSQSIQNACNNTQQNKPFPACPKCNTILKFDTEYCIHCGYKLK